ncbi:MAG: 5-formyltetrahydrofolate cyclo-ligase [Lewinellaceae bacterium]|nr:5-formyltetrahydrofolate cyclo-ligase [Lewinellaceae bacterium]
MAVTSEKKVLRQRIFQLRTTLDTATREAWDQDLCRQLAALIAQRQPQTVHTYLPMAGEVDFFPVIASLLADGVTVVAPKTLPRRQLENRILQSLTELEPGVMGTSFPANPGIYTGTYDMIIVPGLAFDAEGYRLGYGGGYYDTFLAEHPEAWKVALAYPFQVVDQVPREDHDVPVDGVLVGNGPACAQLRRVTRPSLKFRWAKEMRNEKREMRNDPRLRQGKKPENE